MSIHYHKPDEDCFEDCPPLEDFDRAAAEAEYEALAWKQVAVEIPVSKSMLDDRVEIPWDELMRKAMDQYQENLEREVFGPGYKTLAAWHKTQKPHSKAYLWYYRRIRNPADHLRETWRYFRGRHDCGDW